ncbi:MAG: AAA family ATPase [Lewinella sp.]|nr:AAA family ATPase [Lewinella sp.]
MEDLRIWYDGYCFHKKSAHSLYNSDMVLYFLMHFQIYQDYPDYMLDPNIAPDHSKLRMMFEIQNPQSNYTLLEKSWRKNRLSVSLSYNFLLRRVFPTTSLSAFCTIWAT